MPSTLVRRTVQGASLVMIASASVALCQRPSIDVSGRWSLAIRTPEGPQTRTLDLIMATDGSITGSVTAPVGTLDLSRGLMSRDSLHVEFAMAGGQISVLFEAVVRGDTLRGVYRQENYVGELLGVRGDRTVQLPNGNRSLDQLDASAERRYADVSLFAGKKHSRASSATVTSTGVPNTVVVLMNESTPALVSSSNGTNTRASAWAIGDARGGSVAIATG